MATSVINGLAAVASQPLLVPYYALFRSVHLSCESGELLHRHCHHDSTINVVLGFSNLELLRKIGRLSESRKLRHSNDYRRNCLVYCVGRNEWPFAIQCRRINRYTRSSFHCEKSVKFRYKVRV